jgi:hypothetical protein
VGGIVAVNLSVSDSSDDLIGIKIEYNILDDPPDAGWSFARPAGLSGEPTGGGQEPPELAFQGIQALRGGVDLVFFWDTEHDLERVEHEVGLRLTPVDESSEGKQVITSTFLVDNNSAPLIDVGWENSLTNPDQRSGIPIPITVHDDEGDLVEVVFQ